MRIFFLALWGLVLFSTITRPARCQASEPAVALSSNAGWLRLGHYEKKMLGGYESRVANKDFFLSAEGKTSPLLELIATIDALRSEAPQSIGQLKQRAHCAFPARHAWLVKQGVSLPALREACADRDAWKEGLGAAGATLVFSSAYPNNPASMFGHTLLMLNHEGGEPILNYGINFEARVDPSDGSVNYALKGLLGLYPGEYSIAPYYTKINEYNYAESRDLWEYELNLSREEVSTLVNHLWELFASGGFRYYFFDHNCSFQLMTLLEVAKPEWNLVSGYGPYTLPLDTIKKVASHPNAFRSEKVRSSLYRKLNDSVLRLSSAQRELRKNILEHKRSPEQVSDVTVIEAVLTDLDFKRRKEKRLDEREERLLGAALLRRAKLGASRSEEEETQFLAAEEAKIRTEESPLKSHPSHMIFSGFQSRGELSRLTLGGRLSLHDMLDPAPGFSDGFSIEVARLKLSVGLASGDQKLRLEELQFVDILSLYPANSVDTQISWMLRAGTGSRIDFGRIDSLGTLLEGGPGFAAQFAQKNAWIYALGLLYGEHLPSAPKNARFGAGSEAGIKTQLFRGLQLKASSRYLLEINRPFARSGFFEHGAQASASIGQNWQLRMQARTASVLPGNSERIWEWAGQVRWYF